MPISQGGAIVLGVVVGLPLIFVLLAIIFNEPSPKEPPPQPCNCKKCREKRLPELLCNCALCRPYFPEGLSPEQREILRRKNHPTSQEQLEDWEDIYKKNCAVIKASSCDDKAKEMMLQAEKRQLEERVKDIME